MSLVRYKLDELAWSEILQKMNKNASYEPFQGHHWRLKCMMDGGVPACTFMKCRDGAL